MVVKKRKLWPNRRIKSENPDSGDPYSYGGCTPMQMDADVMMKQKDPYEFNDEFDEDSPSSTGFRASLNVGLCICVDWQGSFWSGNTWKSQGIKIWPIVSESRW